MVAEGMASMDYWLSRLPEECRQAAALRHGEPDLAEQIHEWRSYVQSQAPILRVRFASVWQDCLSRGDSSVETLAVTRDAAEGILRVGQVVENDHALSDSLLESAPWNRGRAPQRRYRLAGTMLVLRLVEASMKAGAAGRVRVTATGDVEPFYAGLGFHVCRRPRKCAIMEVDPRQAARLVKRVRAEYIRRIPCGGSRKGLAMVESVNIDEEAGGAGAQSAPVAEPDPRTTRLVRAALASMIDPEGDPDEVLEPLDLYEAAIRHLVSQGHPYEDARDSLSRMSDEELRALLGDCPPAARTASAR